MTRQSVVAAVAMGVLLGSTHVLAQPFKCTGADGKIVYSDTRCEGPAAVAPSAAPAAVKPGGRYELTDADRDRIRNLEVTMGQTGAYSEQKSAAQLEIQNIRRGADGRLTSAERERRESLATDLSSTDAKKRTQALRDLREIYSR